MPRCRICGAPLDVPAERYREVAERFSGGGVRARIVRVLARGQGETILTRDMCDQVYADDIDGGPEWAAYSVRALICLLRRDQRLVGWQIVGHLGAPGGYALLPERAD